MKGLILRTKHIDERNWKHIDGKISRAHRLEKLILVKCSCFPEPSIESMQFLSLFQCFFFLIEIENEL